MRSQIWRSRLPWRAYPPTPCTLSSCFPSWRPLPLHRPSMVCHIQPRNPFHHPNPVECHLTLSFFGLLRILPRFDLAQSLPLGPCTECLEALLLDRPTSSSTLLTFTEAGVARRCLDEAGSCVESQVDIEQQECVRVLSWTPDLTAQAMGNTPWYPGHV
jgi:hypothetical protein